MTPQPTLVFAFASLVSVLFLATHQRHLLMLLLFFEAASLSTTMLASVAMKVNLATSMMIILTFGAVEAALGLSLLVLMARSFGSDMIKSFSLSKV